MANQETDHDFDPEKTFLRMGGGGLLELDLGDLQPVFNSNVVPDDGLTAMLSDLPHLTTALEHRKVDPTLLFTRELLLQQDALDGGVMTFMYEWLQQAGEPFFVLTSPTSLRSPQDKQDFLQTHATEIAQGLKVDMNEEHLPQPLRTVTLTFSGTEESPGRKPVLVTSATNNPFIDNQVKVQIGQDLGLSAKKSKGAIINDARFDAKNFLGLSPGTVGPFVPRGLDHSIQGFYYLQRDLPVTSPVEIAVSPVESLFVKRGPFERMQDAFMRAIPTRKFTSLPITAAV